MNRRDLMRSMCGGLVSMRVPAPKDKIVALFAFDPSIDAGVFASSCREWGINTAILHPGFFKNPKMDAALRKAGVQLWLNVPVFYNREYLAEHPESYSITSRGRKAVERWLHFVCPSREEYVDQLVGEVRACLSKVQPAVVSLDFIRHFVLWEMVDLGGSAASIVDGCYCAVCLSGFERFCGEKLDRGQAAQLVRTRLKRQWGDWKCRRIATVAERLFSEVRALRSDARLAVKTVPWRESDLDGAIRSVAGQDVPALARNVDLVTPMAFTHVLRQTPQWKRALLTHVRELTGKPVLSYVQTGKIYRTEDITPAEFEAELVEALGDSWAGAAVFEYQQLVANPAKAAILRKHLCGL